ncbi:DUF5937 family protein [Amycolatopsis sp. FDAARGOS 1241]|uniref:DUF5937 family protein n=1 Tax=Amycolatopsis sp. FDAARGOS 1241 TaxID=2778070 RepID=UPI00351C814C
MTCFAGHGRRDLLRTCHHDFFLDERSRIHHRLEGECTTVRAHVSALPVAEALASLTTTAAVRHDPLSVVFDKIQSLRADLRGPQCRLVPSVHMRQRLIVKIDPGRLWSSVARAERTTLKSVSHVVSFLEQVRVAARVRKAQKWLA